MELKLEEEILSTNDWGILRILNGYLIESLELLSVEFKQEQADKVRDILANLITIFKINENDDQVRNNLREIYLFTNGMVTKGFNKRDSDIIKEAIAIIKPIYEGFKEKESEQDAKVISGLTYGEKDLDRYGSSSSFSIKG